MERIYSLFGQASTPQQPQSMLTQQQPKEEDQSSLIGGIKQSVFNTSQTVQETVNATAQYQDTRVALVFAVISGLFFILAMMALPMVVLSPASFNLYFVFGSLNLQAAFAFWYGPFAFVKSMFSEGKRLIYCVYMCSVGLCLYIALFQGGYILSLVAILVQVVSLAWVAKTAVFGAPDAGQSSWLMSMLVGNLFQRKEQGLPF